jgi:GNAT superfamily N-acetyltransferase
VLTVGALRDGDVGDALALSAREGWNQTAADWSRLTRLDPGGCFAARDRRRLVATVTVTTYGTELAWIGMMVVHADYRRQGIGGALMHRALRYARDRGVAVVKLDATPAGRPLYESLGFTAEAELDRWHGVACRVDGSTPNLAGGDATAISSLDAAAYGADRSGLLRALAHDAIGGPLVARSEGQPVGYALARRGREAIYIGPIVVNVPSAATDLLDAMLGRLGGVAVCLDHHVGSHLPTSALEDRALTRRRTLLRMRLGPHQAPGTPPSICTSAGPELG